MTICPFCPNCGKELDSFKCNEKIDSCTQNAPLTDNRPVSVGETKINVDEKSADHVTDTYEIEEDTLKEASFLENSPADIAASSNSKPDNGLSYMSLPDNKTSAGATVMGIIALVLGILSLSSIVSSFMLTIDVYKQLTIPPRSFVVAVSSAVPGVVAIILSQKAIDNGYKCGVSKAAEITGAIGAFCHVGVLFILLLGLFI